MCNLYSMTRNRDAIKALFKVGWDRTANQPPLPAIFPDQLAPVVRMGKDGARVMEEMRWGFPPPPNLGGRAVTNIRNAASPYWRGWLKPEFRCLAPASSFCEYTDSAPKTAHWFALGADRPPFAFAGLWRPVTAARGTKAERQALLDLAGSDVQEHFVFAFLTTEPNDVVRPIHAKAMPVLLTSAEEWDAWLTADAPTALTLQRPLAAERLTIVASGPREDAAG